MAYQVEDVLDVLKDGEWHSVRELMVHVSPMKLGKILTFFSEFKFIKWDKKAAQVKLNYDTITFLKRLFGIRIERWYERGRHVV